MRLPVKAAGGLQGHRIERTGAFYALVTRPSVAMPARRARAGPAIEAVDRAGNRRLPARIVMR